MGYDSRNAFAAWSRYNDLIPSSFVRGDDDGDGFIRAHGIILWYTIVIVVVVIDIAAVVMVVASICSEGVSSSGSISSVTGEFGSCRISVI